MPPSSAIPALIANEIDVVELSAAPIITASLRGIDVVLSPSAQHDDLGLLRPSRNQKRRATQRQNHRHRSPGNPGRLRNACALRNRDSPPRTFNCARSAAVRKSSRRFTPVKSPAASARRPPALNWSVVDFIRLSACWMCPIKTSALVVRRGRMDELDLASSRCCAPSARVSSATTPTKLLPSK